MGKLRKPFFIAAVTVILIAVALLRWRLGIVFRAWRHCQHYDLTSMLDDPVFADYMGEVSPADLQRLNKGTPPGRHSLQ